jgi:hypothetical protein
MVRPIGPTLVGVLLLAGCTGSDPLTRIQPVQSVHADSSVSKAAVSTAASSTSARSTPPPTHQMAAPCTWRELAMNYYGGGAGMGNDFGLIRLRDTAPVPCHLTGRIVLLGLNRSGMRDTTRSIYHLTQALTLTPRTPRVEDGNEVPAGTTVASIQIEAEYRDQPHGSPTGLCKRPVIPARWRVTLATGSATVTNIDRSDPYSTFRRLITCAGELTAPNPIVSR